MSGLANKYQQNQNRGNFMIELGKIYKNDNDVLYVVTTRPAGEVSLSITCGRIELKTPTVPQITL